MKLFYLFIGFIRKITVRLRKPNRIVISRPHDGIGKRFSGKNILIIGGGSGIGLNIAKEIAASGGNVLITGRNEKKLKTAAEKCGESCHFLVWDAAEQTSFDEKLAEVVSVLNGKIDGVVFSAGAYINAHFDTCTQSDWDKSFYSNTRIIQQTCESLIKILLDNPNGGSMVVINSIRGIIHDTTPYSLSKVATVQLAKTLSDRLNGTNIRLNTVAPGPTAGTGINKTDVHSDISADQYVCGRFLIPEETSSLVLFLLSDDAKGINGQLIACDCGESLS